MENYHALVTEEKWKKIFENEKVFKTKNEKKEKFYCLEMFPYPS